MGNQPLSVDFVTQLPLEVLSVVLSFLPLCDVLKCMRVCRRWQEVISHLQPYWNNLLLGLDLPQISLIKYAKLFPHKKDLFLDLKRHLLELHDVEFMSTPAVCYPRYHVTRCFMMLQQGVVVRNVETDHVTCLQVERLLVNGRVVSAQLLCVKEIHQGICVVWGHYCRSGCLYWIDSARMGTCYDTIGEVLLHTFDLFKLLPCLFSEKEGLGEGSGVPSDTVMACCEDCSLCVVCWVRPVMDKLEDTGEKETDASSTSLIIRVLSLGDSRMAPSELSNTEVSYKHHHLHNHPCNEGLGVPSSRSFQVISSKLPQEGENVGICQSHFALILDGDHSILVTLVGKENEGNETATSKTASYCQTTLDISLDCLSCRYRLTGISSKMVMSEADRTVPIIGCIAQNHLYIWIGKTRVELSEDKGGLVKLVNKVEISCLRYQDKHTCEVQDIVELVSVGEQLCIVRHWRNAEENSTTNLYIVYTESGKLFKQVKMWLPNHMKLNCSGLCVHHYLISKEAQAWLHDIRTFPPPVLLTVMFSDSEERFGFLSIQQKQLTEQKQQQHWVYAVNSCFRK